jgi:hypothetical protein
LPWFKDKNGKLGGEKEFGVGREKYSNEQPKVAIDNYGSKENILAQQGIYIIIYINIKMLFSCG